jgi:hypothetical protein
VRLIEPRHPDRLQAQHSRIVEDLLEIAENGHHDALNSIIVMLNDLFQQGFQSRYAKALHGTPIWELKTRSRGGLKGGARVYWFPLRLQSQTTMAETVAILVNSEVKSGDKPNPKNLEEALEIYFAFQDNPLEMLQRSS